MTPAKPKAEPTARGVEHTLHGHTRERFEVRARALFYARLALMAIGLGVLLVPAWHEALNVSLPVGVYFYLLILGYQVGSYLMVGRRGARPVLFVTLCLDLLVILYLVAGTGGLKSPLMPAQLVFTMLFALLFPSPLYLIPPLLTLPVMAKIDQILGTQSAPADLLVVLWYSALNVTVVYVMVYLESRERQSFREVVELQRQRRLSELQQERSRIAREIHDSVGAALSGVILQAEYLASREEDPGLKEEMAELRAAASEGMEELRRAVSLMRKDFQLAPALGDLVAAMRQRHRLEVELECSGREPVELDPERQLVLFRIAQEALTNMARHAESAGALVSLSFRPDRAVLEVRDQGRGFAPDQVPAGHYGLRNMAERAAKVGGTLKVTSSPGAGTTVSAEVPLEIAE